MFRMSYSRRQRMHRTIALAAAIFCGAALPLRAGFVQQTVVTSSTGGVTVQAFDSNLGFLTNVSFGATYSGVTGSVTLGLPTFGHGHSYVGGVGPLSFSGVTSGAQIVGGTGTSWTHQHAVGGSTSTASFSDGGASAFLSTQSYAAGGSLSPVNGPTGSHSGSLNQQNWNFTTTTNYTYVPAELLGTVTVLSTGNGLILPDFDETLGTLLRADVHYNWSGQTSGLNQQIGALNNNNHSHNYNLSTQGFSFAGSTGGYLSPSPFAPHLFSGSSSRILYGADLGFFDDGSTIFFSGATTFAQNHNHLITPSLTTVSSEVTFYYMLNAIQSEPVPEPSSLALLGIGGVGMIAGAARRRRARCAQG